MTADDPYAVKWSAENPNYGFGPYTVDSYTPGVSAVLKARPDFVLGAPQGRHHQQSGSCPMPAPGPTPSRNGDATSPSGSRPPTRRRWPPIRTSSPPRSTTPNTFLMMPLVTNKAPFDNLQCARPWAYGDPVHQIVENVPHGGWPSARDPASCCRNAPATAIRLPRLYTYDPAKAKELLARPVIPDGVQFTLAFSAARTGRQGGRDPDPDRRQGSRFFTHHHPSTSSRRLSSPSSGSTTLAGLHPAGLRDHPDPALRIAGVHRPRVDEQLRRLGVPALLRCAGRRKRPFLTRCRTTRPGRPGTPPRRSTSTRRRSPSSPRSSPTAGRGQGRRVRLDLRSVIDYSNLYFK